MTNFFYQHEGRIIGPLTGVKLRDAALAGRVTAQTLVSTSRTGKFVPATRVNGLFDKSGYPLPHPPSGDSIPFDAAAVAAPPPTSSSPAVEVKLTQPKPAAGGLVTSSGGICANYITLGVVAGFASKSEGCGGGIRVESVYRAALDRLIESAKARGANGLIFVNFQNRVASQAGCASARQVFEVFAWGTAIQF